MRSRNWAPVCWAAPRPLIHNDRARRELGWQSRPWEITVVDTAEDLIARGLVNLGK